MRLRLHGVIAAVATAADAAGEPDCPRSVALGQAVAIRTLIEQAAGPGCEVPARAHPRRRPLGARRPAADHPCGIRPRCRRYGLRTGPRQTCHLSIAATAGPGWR